MQPCDRTTALIIVEMQNDFADLGGALSVASGAELIPTISREVAALGFDPTVLEDAIAPVEQQAGDGERAIEEMRLAGVAFETVGP